MKQLIVTALVAGLAGGLGASLCMATVHAQQDEFLNIRDAAHSQVVFLKKDPASLPTPSIPKDWRLVSVGFEGYMWFPDAEGNVYAMDTNMHDDKMAVSPNVHRLPVK